MRSSLASSDTVNGRLGSSARWSSMATTRSVGGDGPRSRSEVVDAGCIATGDQLPLCVGDASDLLVDDLSRVGTRRCRMGEVSRPQDVLDAYQVTQLQTHFIVHERRCHVAPEVLTRLHLQPRELIATLC